MPKGYYTLDQLARDIPRVDTDVPLDATDPEIEAEEPRDDYHAPWGLFDFLYESQRSIDIGGMTVIGPTVGDIALAAPDVWQVPNTEMAGAAPAPAEAPAAADLYDVICGDAGAINQSEFKQDLCAALAASDGCRFVKEFLPSLTGPVDDQSSIPFPNGFKMSISVVAAACTPPTTEIRASIFDAQGTNVLNCSKKYWTSGGPDHGTANCSQGQDIDVRSTFSAAMGDVLICIKNVFSGFHDYSSLGCSP